MKRLEASADEVLLTAAVLHDIERVLKRPDPSRFKEKMKTFTNPLYLAWHQKRSADIAAALLREKNINENIIKRIKIDIIRSSLSTLSPIIIGFAGLNPLIRAKNGEMNIRIVMINPLLVPL